MYDADCATGIKSALSRLEGDPANGQVRLESKEEKSNGGAAPSQALPTHEAHFHQYGRIGVLFLDLYSSRALETGEFNPNTNILNAKQIEFVMKALQIEDLNGILVCMDTNYTGRIISGVEKEKHAVATGLDAWSLNEKVFLQLVQMLYEWNTKKNGRNVQLLSGSNGIGPSGQGLFEDVKTKRVLHQVVVGPMNGPTLNLPPPLIQGVPARQAARGVFQPDLHWGSPQETIPNIEWLEPQRWDRRNYLVLRMFCGLRRDKTFHGERSTTLDRKKEQHVGARAQVTYEFSHGPNPKILLGPVVGTVTSTTAIVLLEIDRAGPITCSIMNVTTSERRMVTRFCPKERPRSFFIQDLEPGTRYAIRFDGVSSC